MKVVDGRAVHARLERRADVVVVGSGPGGAAVARILARGGAKVVVVEAGPHVEPEDYAEDSFTAMAMLYHELGASLSLGNPPMPIVQGKVVGGTSVINGAISWRLPRDVHEGWLQRDPGLEEGLAWDAVSSALDAVERDLNIHPTPEDIAGPNNLLLKRGAEALGLEHRPISRNVKGCRGLGRCLQGCPEGNKMSMDRSYLPDAVAHGAEILAGVRAKQVVVEGDTVRGVVGIADGGGEVVVMADRVVLAAGAVHTPGLLLASGLSEGPVGRRFMCHPGVSVAGHFPEPVRMWTGATQGHEVIGLRKEGLKFEALGYDMALTAARLKGVGQDLSRALDALPHMANWGAAVRAEAQGRIVRGQVVYSLTARDLQRVRRGVRVLGELMLAAGADWVAPGVYGMPDRVTDPRQMEAFETDGPMDGRAYMLAATHLFSTARMGTDPATSVVGPDLQHHRVRGLFVSDASVFPSNTGVNPQTSILAIATVAAQGMVA